MDWYLQSSVFGLEQNGSTDLESIVTARAFNWNKASGMWSQMKIALQGTFSGALKLLFRILISFSVSFPAKNALKVI